MKTLTRSKTDNLTYDEASERFHAWAEQEGHPCNQPSAAISEEIDGGWHLENLNGPLAVVRNDGSVIDVRDFWMAYERLSEDGKCDSPGGGEYRRVLTEWIDDGQPEDLEEFIFDRANVFPVDLSSA